MNGNESINSVNLKAGTDFPYLVLNIVNDQSYPRNPGFQVMHWHEDLQFIYVSEGEIEVVTLSDSIRVRAHNGIFINKNVVHLVRQLTPCHYNSFVFPDAFLRFYPGCPAGKWVDQIAGKDTLPFYFLDCAVDWCAHVLNELLALSHLEQEKPACYVYEVPVRLSAIWLELCRNISLPTEVQRDSVNQRMQLILHFIERHYAQDITLDQLAGSAHISKSECLRCFKISLNMTPYRYLMEYRLAKAADKLRMTSDSVGEIAECVGFHQVSHFGKCFKAKIGLSPRDYRKIGNAS